MALDSVCVTCSCPTTSAKRCGRYFLAMTWYDILIVVRYNFTGCAVLNHLPISEIAFDETGNFLDPQYCLSVQFFSQAPKVLCNLCRERRFFELPTAVFHTS